jgi:hypothetical protein
VVTFSNSFINGRYINRFFDDLQIILRNGEETHFQWSGRGLKDEAEFLSNFIHLMQSFLEKAKTMKRFAKRKPLIFLATDTPRLVREIQDAMNKFGVKTVVLDQIRVKDNEGVTFNALAGKEQSCLKGWQAMFSDMLLLSHSGVLIAVRHSSFTQSLPLSRVFGSHEDEEGPHFCEVSSDANSMTCMEDKKSWLFRDNENKILKISNENDSKSTGQVVHRLLISLLEPEAPKEFEEATRFLKSPRIGNKAEILMHTYGKKGFNPKYRNERVQIAAWNFTSTS